MAAHVPEFLPFTRPSIDEATIAGVAEVLRSGWITTGPQAKAFEAALSAHCGGRPVRAYSSGTITMEIALRLAGVGAGDEVITTPLSWVSTANVVLEVGARPVFVDVDPKTRNIDLSLVETTKKTKAIIPVDLAGLPVDRDKLYSLSKAKNLRVIEDAAQAFGASWRGKPIGSFGDFVSFSFHANKNITTAEGGALVLPSARLDSAGETAPQGITARARTAWTATCPAADQPHRHRRAKPRPAPRLDSLRREATKALFRPLGPLARLRNRSRVRGHELAHVPGRPAGEFPRAVSSPHARGEDRRRRTLSRDASFLALSLARLARDFRTRAHRRSICPSSVSREDEDVDRVCAAARKVLT
jgi:hypothetical protein